MIQRYYDVKVHNLNPSYKDCVICDEWHSLYNFNKWYMQNHYLIAGERMELDKDILVKGNKIYSPDTCVFVPKRINTLILGANKIRGEFPIGVYYDKQKKRYIACLSNGNKSVKVARCQTPIEAFYEYKFYKEQHIRNVAENYKDHIPKCLYNALINWNIEITD